MHDLVIKGGTIVDGNGGAPYDADIAIDDGTITEIGKVGSAARESFDADGAVITPGWIDGHTHYDGQVTWDDAIEGSASNGVTTVLIGNCGVGFAPVRPTDTAALIDLMEGVESIPGTALLKGMPWGEWETFPEYMSYLDGRHWALDVGVQVPHGPLRYYVMGPRSLQGDNAEASEISEMAKIVNAAARAGALGFSTSRVQNHRTKSGDAVPGTFAPENELAALMHAMSTEGPRVFQVVLASTGGERPGFPPEQASLDDEVRMVARISRQEGVPVNFLLTAPVQTPEHFRKILTLAAEENASGARLTPMCSGRALTVLISLLTYHAFSLRPTFRKLAGLPLEQRVAEMRKPEIKEAILSEEDVTDESLGSMGYMVAKLLQKTLDRAFPLEEPLDYEPTADKSIAALAARENRDEIEFFYDFLLRDGGRSVAMHMGTNYASLDLESCREMLLDPNTVTGLSDGGAHVDFLCDTAMPTFQLIHWARDRTRGERLPIELVVKKSTSAIADLYGLGDRGSLEVGKRADINVIDFEHLALERPALHYDLPDGGPRYLQPARGYLATYVHGVQVRADDKDTGSRPGRVTRPSH